MAEISLEEFQRNQSVRISREIIGQSEEHEQRMQTNWQKLWETAHQHLVTLLRFLDQDYDEACEKANHPLEKLADDDLAYLVHIRMRALVDDVKKKEKPGELNEVRRQLNELGQKYSELEQVNKGLVEANKKLQAENSSLNSHLSALRQAQKAVLNQTVAGTKSVTHLPATTSHLASLPTWIKYWQASKGFERSSIAILVMGDTGKALRPSIIKEMAKRLSLSTDNNSLDEAVCRLLTEEENIHPILIERIEGIPEQGSSSGGNNPDALRLTEEGKLAYHVLSGHEPVVNEYDRLIRCHSSPEHTILNIQVAEFLVEAGYLIKGQVQEIQLSNGNSFIPDISAIDPTTGELIFIEVERDVHKDKMTRKQKWINLYEASNGNLYVFCDNLTGQRAIQGEINLALGGLSYNSFLTNLHGLRNGKRSEKDGSIWLSIRRA
jgi:regulator of replication initiation timing